MNNDDLDTLVDFVDAMYNHFREHALEDLGVYPNHARLVEVIKQKLLSGWSWKPCPNPTTTDSSRGD